MARSFDLITRYIPLFSEEEDIGEWIFDKENDGSKEHPIFMPYFRYKDFFLQFITDVASFDEEYFLDNGRTILDNNHIEWSQKGFCSADVTTVDAECIFALLVFAIQLERVHEGLLSSFARDGSIVRWLSRLKEIDDQLENDEDPEDFDEFDDDEEDSGSPSENPTFISFQNALLRTFETYRQENQNENANKFFRVVEQELDRFSRGEEISCGYDFDFCLRTESYIHYVSFHFETDVIEVSDGGSVYDPAIGSDSYTSWMYSIWRNGTSDVSEFNAPDFTSIVELVSEGARLSVSNPDEFFIDDSEEPEN